MRLRLPHIQRVPKKVTLADSWLDRVGLETREDLQKHLRGIRRAIEGGFDLPRGSYRCDADTTPDELLDRLGYMHLHLGRSSSPELLFVIQYVDRVSFVELSDHRHFATDPIGTLLRSLHEEKALREEERTERLRSDAADARRTLLREVLLPATGVKSQD